MSVLPVRLDIPAELVRKVVPPLGCLGRVITGSRRVGLARDAAISDRETRIRIPSLDPSARKLLAIADSKLRHAQWMCPIPAYPLHRHDI
jgi:hypothetical protein